MRANHTPTVLSNHSYSSDDDEPILKTRRARMRARRKEVPPPKAPSVVASIMFPLMLIGLVFCIIDTLYIIKYIMDDRHDGGAFTKSTVNTVERIQNIVSEIQQTRQHSEFTVIKRDNTIRKATLQPELVQQLLDESPDNKDAEDGAKDEQDPQRNEQNAPNVDELKQHEAILPLHPEHKDDKNSFGDDDKEHIVNLLREAGYKLDEETLQQLPKWSDVTRLYGDRPVFIGLEQCSVFRNSGDPADHFVSTAGTFNSGTNLMAELLIHNCHMPERMKKYGAKNRGVRWQVTWGKHTPVDDEDFRKNHETYNETTLKAENIFPAVTVRDPYKWMQSMCRHSYGAHWNFTKTHCPNLIPNQDDLERFPMQQGQETVTVRVKYAEFERYHSSLVGFFNDWYNHYFNAPFPRLIVRFEDLIFHPKEVTKTVCECAGGELNRGKFKYITQSAKKGLGAHGKHRTTYIDAMIKYGTESGRYAHYDLPDLRFANENLDSNLMTLLRYPLGPDMLDGV